MLSRNNYGIEKKYEAQKKIIENQVTEIENLKNQIKKLQIECREKDKTISAVSAIHEDLANTVEDLKGKRGEYDKLIHELKEMKEVMNKTVFNKKWKLIRILLK